MGEGIIFDKTLAAGIATQFKETHAAVTAILTLRSRRVILRTIVL